MNFQRTGLSRTSTTRRGLMIGTAATVTPPLLRPARPQAAGPIRVGVLGDFAGAAHRSSGGELWWSPTSAASNG